MTDRATATDGDAITDSERSNRTPSRHCRDNRGVSIAVTHVLTIAISTLLVVGLLTGAGSYLDTERDRSAQLSLETIGERLAGEIAHADRLDGGETNTTISIQTSQPRSVADVAYTVEVGDAAECADEPLFDDEAAVPCLFLSTIDDRVTVAIPLALTHTSIDETVSVSGGTITIVVENGVVRLEND